MADTVRYGRKKAKCTVRSYRRKRLVVVMKGGREKRIRMSRVRRMGFGKSGRCALFRSKKGKEIAVKVFSFRSGTFRCRTSRRKDVSITLSRVRSADFFPVSRFVRRLDVPFVRQKPDYCGEACIEMVTAYFGRRVTQKKVHAACDVGRKRGAYSHELEEGIVKLGLKTADEFNFPGKRGSDFLEDRTALMRAIEEERPVLLGFWYNYKRKKNAGKWGFDHFVLLVGYDLRKSLFYIHDPARRRLWKVTFDDFVKHRKNRFGSVYRIEFFGLK